MEIKKMLGKIKWFSSVLVATPIMMLSGYCTKNIDDIKHTLSNCTIIDKTYAQDITVAETQKLNLESQKEDIPEQEKKEKAEKISVHQPSKPKVEDTAKHEQKKEPEKISVHQPSKPKNGETTEREKRSETVYVTETGKCYHKDGCKHLRRSKIAVSKEKAEIMYRTCKDCQYK